MFVVDVWPKCGHARCVSSSSSCFELLGLTAPCTPACSKALAAVLADAHVFDLSPADAHRAAETVAFEPIRAGWVLADAADAVTDRAIAAQLDRDTRLRRRMAVGLALHRAARVLEAGG